MDGEVEASRKAYSTAWVGSLSMRVVHSTCATQSPCPGITVPLHVPWEEGGNRGRGEQSGPEEALSSQALAAASISKVLLLGEKESILQLPALPVQVSRGLCRGQAEG